MYALRVVGNKSECDWNDSKGQILCYSEYVMLKCLKLKVLGSVNNTPQSTDRINT